jgi:hypothetical protein
MAEEGLPEANQGWNMENFLDLIEMSKVDSNLPGPLHGFPTFYLFSLLLLPVILPSAQF